MEVPILLRIAGARSPIEHLGCSVLVLLATSLLNRLWGLIAGRAVNVRTPIQLMQLCWLHIELVAST